MRRVLYAWEMGAGLGHLAAFLPLAECLRIADCEVVCAVRDTQTAAQVLAPSSLPWMQAPFLLEEASSAPLLTYTDILLRYGFGTPTRLAGHIGAWLSILELYKPHLLIADHSPAALLAARMMGIPTMLFGTGFCCPPACFPMLPLRPWDNPDPAQMMQSENQAQRAMQQAATLLGKSAPHSIGELLSAQETAILGFPELDHYLERPQLAAAQYWGNLGAAGMGETPRWPPIPGRKIFVYVRPAYRHLAKLFQALADLGLPTLVYCPGIDVEHRALLQMPHIVVAEAPLNLSVVFQEADAAITNGSFSSSTGFLQAGKPVLVLPTHLEQFLFGWRVEQNEMGLLSSSDHAPPDLLPLIYRVATDPVLRTNAEAFSARYRAFDQPQVLAHMTARVMTLTGHRT